jgi:hypothetical protein
MLFCRYGGKSKEVNLALTCALGEQIFNLPTNQCNSPNGRLIWGMDNAIQYPNFIGKSIESNNPLAGEVDVVSEERGGGGGF